jgi:protease IV
MPDDIPPPPQNFQRPQAPWPGAMPPPPPPQAPIQMGMQSPQYRLTRTKSSFWKVAGILVLVGVVGFNLLLFAGMFGVMSGGGGDRHAVMEHTRQSGGSDKIVVITVEGVIMESQGSLFSAGSNPVELVHDSLEHARNDSSVKAVILEVNSPGGGITASDLIHHEIVEFRKQSKIPVVVYMKDLAASGGYYISAPCDVIVANRTTLTGSIGVIMQGFNLHGTLTEILKGRDATIKAGNNKDMGSMFADPDSAGAKESRRLLQVLVDEMHAQFKAVVKEGRGSNLKADWEAHCDGRILTAKQALELGFIDKIGYFDTAVAEAKRLSGATDPTIVEYGRSSGLAALFGAASNTKGASAEDAVADAMARRMEEKLKLYPGKPMALWIP